MFDQGLPHSEQASSTFPRQDRRATIRFPTAILGSCEPLAGQRGEGWQATVRDISRGGLCLNAKRRFERGTVLIVELSTALCPARSLVVQVKYMLPAAGDAWVLGCAFLQQLSDQEVQELLVENPDSR